ncbi:MAG: Spo0E family sporulation regulatory protein-aspartic acid phosphatase [Firmicutes bacterium]|nr:Spo0E family sporulation regulatory protein-aspartic acid phosphatase [Bacillota bacterium]
MDRKAQLAREIEALRKKLNRESSGENRKFSRSQESLSCKLDQLIVEYTRIKEGNR